MSTPTHDFDTAVRQRLAALAGPQPPSPAPRFPTVASAVSACDCHLRASQTRESRSGRVGGRGGDLPDPSCWRCRGTGEVIHG